MMAMCAAKYRFTETSAKLAGAHSFCSRFMSASAIAIGDAIIVASIFIVLLTAALYVRVFMLAVLVSLVAVVLLISHNNLIPARRKISEPRS